MFANFILWRRSMSNDTKTENLCCLPVSSVSGSEKNRKNGFGVYEVTVSRLCFGLCVMSSSVET